MITIIDQLIEIENKAQKITNQAKQKKQALSQELKQRQQAMEKKIYNEYQVKINTVMEQEFLEEEEKINASNQKKEHLLESMEKDFSENHQRWEKELFNKIIGW